MINGHTVLAIVPARGGSKGIPGKNIADVAGLPLIAWTLRATAACPIIDQVVVSTDDAEIAEVARAHGGNVPFLRPLRLAQDETPALDVVKHALLEVGDFSYVVLLQPTSPTRTWLDIEQAVRACVDSGAPACVSVSPVGKSPYWMYFLEGQRLQPVLPTVAANRRQDLPPVYVLNGAIYVARWDWLRCQDSFVGEDTIAYVMSAKRSFDIDRPEDLEAAAAFLAAEPDAPGDAHGSGSGR